MKTCLAFLLLIAVAACGNTASTQSAPTGGGVDDETVAAAGMEIDADSVAPAPECDLPADGTVTMAFCGDIMMGTTYPERKLPPNDGRDLFTDVAAVLSGADIAASNLEGTLFDGVGTPKKCGSNCYTFKTPTAYVDRLVEAGLDFMSVANNHANDFGPEGVRVTHSTLRDAGIAFAGMRADCPTAVIELPDGRRIGFAAFGHSQGTLSILDIDEMKRVVKGLDKECDMVVVSFHGGAEGSKYTHVPHEMELFLGEKRGNVEQFAHAAIDAGADVVYGHGPHVTRALELYGDRLIIYSLGNFCTPYGMNLRGVNSHAPVVTVTVDADGRFVDGRIHSFVQQSGTGPRRDPTNSVAAQMRSLTASDFPSTPLLIEDDGTLRRK